LLLKLATSSPTIAAPTATAAPIQNIRHSTWQQGQNDDVTAFRVRGRGQSLSLPQKRADYRAALERQLLGDRHVQHCDGPAIGGGQP
jgi:hypothetical protein